MAFRFSRYPTTSAVMAITVTEKASIAKTITEANGGPITRCSFAPIVGTRGHQVERRSWSDGRHVDAALDEWLAGNGRPQPFVWTIWGYHVLGDIANQLVLEDPYAVIAGWHRRLVPYPGALKRALVARHPESIRYWRADYHYAAKVERCDRAFLSGITQKLAHDLVQISSR